jgi:hypothetical protein
MVQSAWSLDLCEFEKFFRYADFRSFSSIRLHIRHSQYPGAEDYILVCYLVSMRSEKKCYYTRDCVVPSAGFSARDVLTSHERVPPESTWTTSRHNDSNGSPLGA